MVQALSLEGTVTRAFARENRGSQGEDVQARRQALWEAQRIAKLGET